MTDIAAFFASLSDRDPQRTANFSATYLFRVDGAGSWLVTVDGGALSVREASDDDSAECIVAVTAKDFQDLLAGHLNTQMAFMEGKLLIEGDMGLAMKLGAIL